MTDKEYLERFAATAKTVSEEEFAKAARTPEGFYRCTFSVHFFNPGWTWKQAEAEVRRILSLYPTK